MTSGTFVVVDLLGNLALLLWGVRMVRTGIMRGWSDRLRNFIERHLSNRAMAFGAGAAGAIVLSSTTAMSLIVSGLAGVGAIQPATGLAILLGAGAGSALLASLFATGSSLAATAAPIILFAGFIVFSLSHETRPRNVGRALIGLGLTFLALKGIVAATVPLREATLFHEMLQALTGEPMLGFIAGAVLAWLCHSTLAVVLLVASLLLSGSLELAGAVPVILGINFGGGLPAVTATLHHSPSARLLPAANLVCRGVGALALLPMSGQILAAVEHLPLDPMHAAVSLHAAFNVGVGVLFLPLCGFVVTFMSRVLPNPPAAIDTLASPRYLDKTALDSPATALSNAAIETTRMCELLERMFGIASEALATRRLETLKEMQATDARLGHYMRSVQDYLAQIPRKALGQGDERRMLEVMHYASNLEHAGDVIKLSLASRIKTKVRLDVDFTAKQASALAELRTVVEESLRLVPAAIGSRDANAAARLAAQKDSFRRIEDRVIGDHLAVEAGKGRAASRNSALFVDIVRDLHSINSHIASAGYPIVQAAGLLHDSRIRA
jgi:phosphate:Na+ symporter